MNNQFTARDCVLIKVALWESIDRMKYYQGHYAVDSSGWNFWNTRIESSIAIVAKVTGIQVSNLSEAGLDVE